ncbi:Mitochondrial import receptor subunit TOM6 homolog, partial [Linum perenne]
SPKAHQFSFSSSIFFRVLAKRKPEKRSLAAHLSAIMFPGMFMKKPDKAEAYKQLKFHAAMFTAWVAVIRVSPYLLHYLSAAEKEELKLEF